MKREVSGTKICQWIDLYFVFLMFTSSLIASLEVMSFVRRNY